MKHLRTCLSLLPLLLVSRAVHAESDVRDLEGTSRAKNNTAVALGYFHHEMGDDNHQVDQAIFRGLYVLRFGDVVLVPIDLAIAAADVTAYKSAEVVNPALAPLNFAIRGSGLSDLTYLPSLTYVIPQTGKNHTVLQFNPRLTLPTGNYDATKPINIGSNRLTFTPYIGVAQRFATNFTAEAYGFVTFNGTNSDVVIPATATSAAVQTSQSQSPNFGADVHLAFDMSKTFLMGASYYFLKRGDTTLNVVGAVAVAEPTTQTVRFSFGIRIEKGTLLLLQYNHDLTASNGGAISQFFGARISHVFLEDPKPSEPAPAAPAPAPAPAE